MKATGRRPAGSAVGVRTAGVGRHAAPRYLRECAVVELPWRRCFWFVQRFFATICECSDVMVVRLLWCLGGVGDEYMHGGGNVHWQPKGAANEFA